MALPKAVEDAAREADEMLLKMQPAQSATDEKTEEAPEKVEEEKSEEPITPVAETVEEKVVEPEKVKEPETATADTKEYERLKQAHAVLQGKYNAEIPRLYQQIKDLEARLTPAKAEPAKEEEQPQNLSDVFKKLTEDYGEDFAKGVRTLIREEIAPALTGV